MELFTQLNFCGLKHAPDLGLALAISFAQGTHVALDQVFHQLLDAVLGQVAAQQGNAHALVTRIELVGANQHQRQKKDDFHKWGDQV